VIARLALAAFTGAAIVLGLVGTALYLTAEAARPGRHYE
jgi:hypothetical protein